jgi:XTP/dITP diphosphohydrolase
MEQGKSIIYFITRNSHKYNEIQQLFNNENLTFNIAQKNLPTIEIQTNNLKDVALFKLNSIKGNIHGSYFIEDSGFFIDKPLNGFPGVWSKYVFETIGTAGILKLIDNFKATEAHFESIIAFYYQPQDKVHTFQGIVKGKVANSNRGIGGFGFDPIFIPNDISNKTFAELSTEEKNKISHRGRAWRKFTQFLKELK